MADDDQDDSQKTEEPSQKKLDEAKKKGEVVSSREVNHAMILLAGTLLLMMFVPGMLKDIMGILRKFIAMPHLVPIDGGGLRNMFMNLLGDMIMVMLVPALFLIVAAASTGIIQHGFIFTPEKIKPKLEKISLIAGVKRQFSMTSFMEFLKGVFKLTLVGALGVFLIVPEFSAIDLIPRMDVPGIVEMIYSLAIRLMIGVVFLVVIIAGMDFLYQNFQHLKKMRMSKQDLKDEYKQSEGDPVIKSRLRAIRMERARKRMMAQVPDADVVVTNPTHYAVALKYDNLAGMSAPVCIAKGVDAVALRIRDVAKESDVSVVENPPLARALYAGVEIDEEIPEEHFKAVASIISYVFKMKNKLI